MRGLMLGSHASQAFSRLMVSITWGREAPVRQNRSGTKCANRCGFGSVRAGLRLTEAPCVFLAIQRSQCQTSKTTQIIIKIITCDDMAERVGSDHHRSNQFYPLQKASSAGFLWLFPRSYPVLGTVGTALRVAKPPRRRHRRPTIS